MVRAEPMTIRITGIENRDFLLNHIHCTAVWSKK